MGAPLLLTRLLELYAPPRHLLRMVELPSDVAVFAVVCDATGQWFALAPAVRELSGRHGIRRVGALPNSDFGYLGRASSSCRDSPRQFLLGPDRDLPPFPVMPVCLERDEPAALFQNFGRFERALPYPGGGGARGDKCLSRKWWVAPSCAAANRAALVPPGELAKELAGALALAAVVPLSIFQICPWPPSSLSFFFVGIAATIPHGVAVTSVSTSLKGSTSNASGLIDLSKCRT